MDSNPQRPKDQEGSILALNAAINALNLANTLSIPPAKAVFSSVSILLATIKVRFPLFRNDLLQVHT
jgi:hypothetical protein